MNQNNDDLGDIRCALAIRTDLDQGTLLKANGATQNAKFLMDQLLTIGVDAFFLVSHPVPGDVLSIAGTEYPALPLDSAHLRLERLDLVIEATMLVSSPHRETLRQRFGCKIAVVHFGNILRIDTEEIFLRRMQQGITHYADADAVWTSPHYVNNVGYLETLYNKPVRIIPYLWQPDFVNTQFHARDYGVERNVYVMEPNFNVTKTALIPLAIIEQTFRQNPNAFSSGFVLNMMEIRNNPYFLDNVVRNMSSLQAETNKVFFAGRHGFDEVFGAPDVLLSHQWDNELNYTYCEALYKGIPLVHNSPRMADVGFYYQDNDVAGGAQQLMAALAWTPTDQELARGRQELERFSIHNPAVQEEYRTIIRETALR